MEGTSAPVCEEPDATSSGNGDVANAKSVRGRGRGTTRGHSKRAGKTTGDGRGRGGKDIVAEDGPMLKWVTPSPAKASSKAHPTNKKDEEGDLDLTFRTSIVGWMEIDQNRFSVYGHTKKTPVGTKVGTKEQGWVNASDHINSTTGLKLTGDSTRKRMARYREKYISVSKWANSTGAGVPEGSSAQNLDEYLEELCPHYGRMNALFWNSPHKEPHGELSIEAGGLCTFSSRKTKYTMGILSVDDNEGGRAVSANVDESIWEEGHEDQVDQLYGEGGLGSKQGFESERGRLHNNNPYYYNGQDGQARGSQATVTFSGAAFTEFRRPPLERSESGLSASKSTSSSKRSHSGDRSESSQGGAKSSFANPRQEPVINMHSHQPSQEEQRTSGCNSCRWSMSSCLSNTE
ncbi:MAG: hypothetical protein J3R72DRAFT_462015 [Linnemannia gamsii]|nr:MAG: hypothetical protein J3R72DRAFT_462015 [Linnemannia gamsii]